MELCTSSKECKGTSLEVQLLRPRLPMQGCRFDPWLGSEDPTCLVAKKKKSPKQRTGAIQ